MALKDTWKDKQDGDYVSAEDLNMIAGTIIDLENNQGQGSGGSLSATIVDGVLILNSKSNTKYTSSINNGILIIK